MGTFIRNVFIIHNMGKRKNIPATVIELGRITIPVDVRNDLDIEKGDRVLIDVEKLDEAVNDD